MTVREQGAEYVSVPKIEYPANIKEATELFVGYFLAVNLVECNGDTRRTAERIGVTEDDVSELMEYYSITKDKIERIIMKIVESNVKKV